MVPAPPLIGVRPDGMSIAVDVGEGRCLVAFLTTGCATCGWWWDNLAAPPECCPPLAAVVTPEPALESPRAVAAVAPPAVTVVMSGEAWERYGVRQSSTFVLVDGGRIAARVVAASWADVLTLPPLRATATSDGAGRRWGLR